MEAAAYSVVLPTFSTHFAGHFAAMLVGFSDGTENEQTTLRASLQPACAVLVLGGPFLAALHPSQYMLNGGRRLVSAWFILLRQVRIFAHVYSNPLKARMPMCGLK